MKLEKNKIKYKRLFELHLIKSRIYEQPIKKNMSENLPDVNLSNIMLNLKKALQVIFKYHINNKRILFLGVPKVIETTLNSQTSHTAVSNSFNIKRLQLSKSIKNSVRFSTRIAATAKASVLPKLKNKPDLIVLFDQSFLDSKYEAIVKEAYTARIPVIKFNDTLQELYWKHCYGVPGNLNTSSTKIIDNIFFTIVNSMLKTPTITKSNNFK
jgi:ribosomal protein S2